MIQIASWNDGFETHDSRKTRGKLSWVRQNILMGEVAWAKLWLRPDAPEIWAGWTALVWASAQAETRGTTTNAEDVALVSRVPQAMVEKAIEWALSNGFAQLSGDLPEKLPQPSRCIPDDLPIDSRQVPDVSGNHPDYSTVQDSTRQDEQTKQTRARTKVRPPFNRSMFDHLLPSRLSSDTEFMELWGDYLQDRSTRKDDATENAAKAIVKKFDDCNVNVCKEALRKSIISGWAGVFPESVDPTKLPKVVTSNHTMITVSPEIRERELRLREQYKTERPF